MRITFFGSSKFSIPVLEALIDSGHEIVCVCCQPPKPSGRGQKIQKTVVEKRASELGLEIKYSHDLNQFIQMESDAGIVASYGRLIPKSILDAPKHGLLNIHPSLLPRWRGATPIQRAIIEGDQETGVCIMRVVEELDAGPLLMRCKVGIKKTDTFSSLEKRLSAVGAALIVDALNQINSLKEWPQGEDGITYACKIYKEETRIDWGNTSVEIDRKIRGLSYIPGAWCVIGGKRVKLLNSRIVKGDGKPGQVIDNLFTVACGNGAVQVTEVQQEGKRRLLAGDYLRGNPLNKGILIT